MDLLVSVGLVGKTCRLSGRCEGHDCSVKSLLILEWQFISRHRGTTTLCLSRLNADSWYSTSPVRLTSRPYNWNANKELYHDNLTTPWYTPHTATYSITLCLPSKYYLLRRKEFNTYPVIRFLLNVCFKCLKKVSCESVYFYPHLADHIFVCIIHSCTPQLVSPPNTGWLIFLHFLWRCVSWLHYCATLTNRRPHNTWHSGRLSVRHVPTIYSYNFF